MGNTHSDWEDLIFDFGSVSCVSIGFDSQLQPCHHSQAFVWLYISLQPTMHWAGQGSCSEQELADPTLHPPCQNHSDFTTQETCEHDTTLGGKQHAEPILSRLRPSEMNVLAPLCLISLIHPYRFRFPYSQTHFVTLEIYGSKPKFTTLHFWRCLADAVLLTMCAFELTYLLPRLSQKEMN